LPRLARAFSAEFVQRKTEASTSPRRKTATDTAASSGRALKTRPPPHRQAIYIYPFISICRMSESVTSPQSFASAARKAALCSRVPSRLRRGRGGKSPQGRAHDARSFAVRPRMACQRTSGASSRSHAGMDARVTAAARVPFSLVTFSWASKRK